MFQENSSWIACETVLLSNAKFLRQNKGPVDMEEYVLSRRDRLKYLRQNVMVPQLLSNDS